MTASELCCVSRTHKQFRLCCLLMVSWKFRSIAENTNATKEGLEPPHVKVHLVAHPVGTTCPRVINVDKNAAYSKALNELKAIGTLEESCELRPVKYLNNLVEQDHRFIKRLVKPGLGFFSFQTAWRILQGYEAMNMIRKGQMQGVGKGDIRCQIVFIARLFGVAA